MSPTRPQEDDDGATTIRTGPHSGLNSDFVTSSMYIGDSLPEGLRLGEYEVLSVIGEGGFGIVYLAYDHFLQRQVALKEYMPSSLAGRSRMGLEVTIKSERHRDTFQAGLKSFINEARLLAQFDHRALVKVYRFWEGNGTAYMVMPYVVGPTLKAALAEMPAPPDEAWLRGQVLTPLMEALSLLHKASCLHRDIAPDNILLTETGPMLLDFGAARKVIGDLNQTLTVVLKPGYAPIEQYGEVAALTQGPWTDVYALGGVVRYAITGKVPVSATTRLVQDTMVPMAQLAGGRYGEAFLRAVDAALAVRPQDRPQDMAQFAALLGVDEGVPTVAAPFVAGGAAVPGPVTVSPSAQPRTVGPAPPAQPGAPSSAAQAAMGAEVSLPSSVQAAIPAGEAGAPPDLLTRPRPTVVPAPAPAKAAGARAWLVLAGLLALAVVGVAAWLLLKPSPNTPPTAPSTEAGTAVPAPMAASAVSPPAISPMVPPATEPPAPVTAVPDTPLPSSPVPAQGVARPAEKPAPAQPPATRQPPVAQAATPSRATAPLATPEGAVAKPPATASRCSDLLQKASLEPLTPGETSFLKTECR